jgi:hypothetical protein
MRRLSLAFVGLAVSLSVTLPVHARRKRGAAAHSVDMAIFPVATAPKTNAALASAFDEAVGAAVVEAGLDAIAGAQLSKRLKLAPRVAIERCKGDLGCIAKLGKRLRVSEVLFARAVPRSLGGIEIVIVAVTSADASVARKRTLEIGGEEEIKGTLAGSFAEIFKNAPPAGLAGGGAAPPDETVDQLALEPLPDLAALPTAAPPAEEQTTGAESGEAEEEIPLELVLATGEKETGAAATPNPGPIAPGPAGPEHTSYLFYGGMGLAGLGVAALAGASVFGLQSRRHYDEAAPTNVPQVEAKDMVDRANDETDRANLLFVTAGALAVAGGVLIVLDTFVFTSGTSASVSLGPDGASASLAVEF